MAWFSRLVPQRPSLRRLADHNQNHRGRQGNRRRRTANLETLENRTLLSNVTATLAAGILTVTGDVSNDNFAIIENLNGTVTVSPGGTRIVPGVGVVPGSTINSGSAPFTTSSAVTAITVFLPGTSSNFDAVQLLGPGKNVQTKIVSVTVTVTGTEALSFSVNNVDNEFSKKSGKRGTLDVNDVAQYTTGGALSVTVDNSRFTALSIFAVPLAYVELGNDDVTDTVIVDEEGLAKGDQIVLDNHDHFSSVSLRQGASSASPALNDIVTVDDTDVDADLTILQGSTFGGSNNAVNIATTGSVTIGNFSGKKAYTNIYQYGGNNSVTLGGAASNFETHLLDVYTGANGNGKVIATNTDTAGPNLGHYVVTGGPPYSNTYVDGGGNTHTRGRGVSVDPQYSH